MNNQNTTIETIREAIEKLGMISRHLVQNTQASWERTQVNTVHRELDKLLNRLEAAPPIGQQSKEQPPVEQSVWNVGQIEQDERGHPSPVGLVEIYDSKKFCHTCRAVDCSHIREVVEMGKTQGWFITFEVGKVKPAAPPAVIEPEPELDEFEKWATELIEDTDFHARYLSGVNDALKMYRVTRKGDK